MKICIISHSVHPYSEIKTEHKHSSVNDVLFNLSYGFKDLGHEVFLILPTGSDSQFPMFVANGEYQPNLGISQNSEILSTATGSSLLEMMDYAFKNQADFDIIINLGHDWLPNYMANKFTTPYISIPNLLCEGRPLEELIKIRAKESPDNIMFISYFQRRVLGGKENKVIYLPFDVSSVLPATQEKENYLFWAGRIIPEKGLSEAIIFAEEAGIPLVVAGEIQDHIYFEDLNKKHQFKYLGILNKSELYYQMNKATAFLQLQKHNTLYKETFGRVTAEALLNGCPVVYTDNGANREIVTLANGGIEYSRHADPKNIMHLIGYIDIFTMQRIAMIRFSRELIAKQHVEHFKKLIN